MHRWTSIETFHHIRDNGLLSKRRFEVYQTVYMHGPMTSAEAFSIMNKANPLKNLTQSRARFTELQTMAVLKTIGERKCKITGRNALIWEVTDRLPIKIDKPVKHKCNQCRGTGYISEIQLKML